MNPQDTHHFNFSSEQLNNFLKGAGIICAGMLTLFLLALTVNEVKSYASIGNDSVSNPAGMQNVISVTGQSEMFVRPDVTTFTWTISAVGNTSDESQSKAAEIEKKALDFLKSKGIKEADLKTTNYYTYPNYSTKVAPCVSPKASAGSPNIRIMNTSVASEPAVVAAPGTPVAPCSVTTQETSTYTTTESVEVKVRDIKDDSKKVGNLIAGVAAFGVTTSTPINTVDKPEIYKQKVRDEAILKARQQAEVLAKALGVKLVRITGFNENSYPYPMYDGGMMSARATKSESVAPELPTGTNKITSDVSITYQIR